ncbi:MAG TPA: efflux RND transporter periplasmic adaptor subunit [Flavobacteriaceae bacterium]|nr:efflux RND transporter periplasmic adaptor subunit [Flavobacteriaceae bacterium]
MKKIIYIVLAVALVILAGFQLMRNKEKTARETAIVAQENATVAVRVEKVKNEIVHPEYKVNGNFAPFQHLMLSSERGGQVVQILVKEGDEVKIGQTLATIKADLYSVEMQSAEAAYQTALKDAQRFENAFKTGGVTQQQLDQVKLQLQAAKARLDQAKITVGDSRIKATINGIVNKRHVEPGSIVGPGSPLFEIVNVSKLKMNLTVDENQVANINKGDEVIVKASVYANKEFEGKVSFVAPLADGSMNFPVEVEIVNNDNQDLRAGMYGSVIFQSQKASETPILTVPRNAFVGSVSNNEIFVVKDSVVFLTKVSSGRNFGEKVEILEGLKEGDVVVTSGQVNLFDGTAINIVE